MGLLVAVQYGAALSEDLDFVFILKALTAHFVINVISECLSNTWKIINATLRNHQITVVFSGTFHFTF